MTQLLFDTPWWLPAVIAAVGVVLFISGNKRQETRVRAAGMGAVMLAAMLAVVSYVVDTDLEKAEKGSRRLLSAFVAEDWPAMQAVLHPRATLDVSGGDSADGGYGDRDQIIAAAKVAQQSYGVESVTVMSMESTQNDTLILITVRLFAQARNGPPNRSTWQFEWQPTDANPDGWAIYQVRALELDGADVSKWLPKLPDISKVKNLLK
jgi:hypothetical protein